jgi:hypothetical protein
VRLLRHFAAFPLRWRDHASSDRIQANQTKSNLSRSSKFKVAELWAQWGSPTAKKSCGMLAGQLQSNRIKPNQTKSNLLLLWSAKSVPKWDGLAWDRRSAGKKGTKDEASGPCQSGTVKPSPSRSNRKITGSKALAPPQMDFDDCGLTGAGMTLVCWQTQY